MSDELATSIAERESRIRLSRYHRTLHRVVERALPIDGKVLDVGCGYGGHSVTLCTGTRTVIGVDLRTVYPSVGDVGRPTAAAADATSLPFCGDAFDAVYSLDLLEHVADDAAMVHECFRVLRPGGVAIVETPNVDRLSIRVRQLMGKPMEFPRVYGDDPALGPIFHEREYAADQLEHMFAIAGFHVAEIRGLWLGLTRPEVGMRRAPRRLRHLAQSFVVIATKPRSSCS